MHPLPPEQKQSKARGALTCRTARWPPCRPCAWAAALAPAPPPHTPASGWPAARWRCLQGRQAGRQRAGRKAGRSRSRNSAQRLTRSPQHISPDASCTPGRTALPSPCTALHCTALLALLYHPSVHCWHHAPHTNVAPRSTQRLWPPPRSSWVWMRPPSLQCSASHAAHACRCVQVQRGVSQGGLLGEGGERAAIAEGAEAAVSPPLSHTRTHTCREPPAASPRLPSAAGRPPPAGPPPRRRSRSA